MDKLPAQGPYIISSNHQSYLDPVLMSAFLPWQIFRNLFAVGTSEIFGSGFMRRLARWLRVIVVDPDSNLVPAMRAGAFGLKHGRILILYPEGERSIDGTPRTFKKGAAICPLICRCRLFQSRSKDFTMHGRAANASRDSCL